MKKRCENPLTRPAGHEDEPDIIIDGRLHASTSWCFMCVACHAQWGAGLGTGRGQKFKNKESGLEKIKIEG